MFVQKLGGASISPRTGRPTNNPKGIRVGFRLTEQEKEMLDYCEKHLDISKTEIISLGIKLVYDQIKGK